MNSMTGFGRAQIQTAASSIKVELSGVNRKQLEIAINIPRGYAEWEQSIRPVIQNAVSRGRVSVSITVDRNPDSSENTMFLDETRLAGCMKTLDRASEVAGRDLPLTVSDLIRLEVMTTAQDAEESAEELWPLVEPTLREALDAFLSMRSVEGENLKKDLLEKLSNLENFRSQIADLAPSVPSRLRDSMVKRLEEAGLPVDLGDDRIIRELAVFADKCDVTEEITRLASHFSQFKALCDSSTPSGRPLDFLCQEIFREFNTIGSKANDATLAHLVVAAKTDLEKIREQVQNIE